MRGRVGSDFRAKALLSYRTLTLYPSCRLDKLAFFNSKKCEPIRIEIYCGRENEMVSTKETENIKPIHLVFNIAGPPVAHAGMDAQKIG